MSGRHNDMRQGYLLAAAVLCGPAGLVLSGVGAWGCLTLDPMDHEPTAEFPKAVFLVGVLTFAVGWGSLVALCRNERRAQPTYRWDLGRIVAIGWGLLLVTDLILFASSPFIMPLVHEMHERQMHPPSEGDVFYAGEAPWGLAFDGENLWVANSGGNTVTKLKASDGEIVGTYSVGDHPHALAFDGSDIWVAGWDGVVRLSASDGSLVGKYNNGVVGDDIAFDGVNLWIVTESIGAVTVLKASDGSLVAKYSIGINPQHVMYDGANIWVSGSRCLLKLNTSDGGVLGSYPMECDVGAMAYDGTKLWVTLPRLCKICVVNPSDGTVIGTYEVGKVGKYHPESVAFDGSNIWVTSIPKNTLIGFRASDGSLVKRHHVGLYPVSVLFDGTYIWVANNYHDTLTRLEVTG